MVVMGTNLATEDIVIGIYGGESWTNISDKFLIGAGSTYAVNATGGSTTHTIASGELPAHTHSIPALSGTAASAGSHFHAQGFFESQGSGWAGYCYCTAFGTTPAGGSVSYGQPQTQSGGAHTHSVTTVANTSGSTGSGTAMSILNPYYAVYIWIRTA